MRTVSELRRRIDELREGDERLDRLDYLKRGWLAEYSANVGIVADVLEELIGPAHEPGCCMSQPIGPNVQCCCLNTPKAA